MKNVFLAVALTLVASSAFAGVKKIYVGSYESGRAQYVIECTNGNSYSSINQRSNGNWYSYSSSMGDDYRNLSIEAVADRKCN